MFQSNQWGTEETQFMPELFRFLKDKLGWEPTIQVEDWIRANIPPLSQTRLDKWRRLWIGI